MTPQGKQLENVKSHRCYFLNQFYEEKQKLRVGTVVDLKWLRQQTIQMNSIVFFAPGLKTTIRWNFPLNQPGFDKDQEEDLYTLLMGTKLQNWHSYQRFTFFLFKEN